MGRKLTGTFTQPFPSMPKCRFDLPPTAIRSCFEPAKLLNSSPTSWVEVLSHISPKLPVQVHVEPLEISLRESPDAPPLFRSACSTLLNVPEVEPLITSDLNAKKRKRVKLRLSGGGKFIHRNRFVRRSVSCILSGTQHWLFIDSSDPKVNILLDGVQNENWNGFRSRRFPSALTLAQMHSLACEAQNMGIRAHILALKAGDILKFNGQWWHATCYASPVLSLFCVFGKDMESAVSEHKNRMKMKKQKKLGLATIVVKETNGNVTYTSSQSMRSGNYSRIAGYIIIRLFAGALFDIFGSYLFLAKHPEANHFGKFCVQLDFLKVLHLVFTLSPQPILYRVAPILFIAAAFSVGFAFVNEETILNSTNCALLVLLQVALIAKDAALDTECLAGGVYLQPAKAAASAVLFGTLCQVNFNVGLLPFGVLGIGVAISMYTHDSGFTGSNSTRGTGAVTPVFALTFLLITFVVEIMGSKSLIQLSITKSTTNCMQAKRLHSYPSSP